MKSTPETQTPEPETAEAPTTKAAESKADLKKSDTPDDTTRETASDVPGDTPADDAATTGAAPAADLDEDEAAGEDDELDLLDGAPAASSGLGAAAAAVVAVCLGIVALTGTWTSKVLAERQGLVGQLKTGQSATAEQQISAIYGDAWHVTAAVNGGVALVALLLGVIVLTLPRREGWVRPFALAGAVLGFLGLLISTAMYFDLFAALPATGA
ncbi:hypothetical protein PUR57_03980 [Streptomyces sp. JV176]|uniref:hypothetical protein n=1 Tax=Streptomyces sp. JV176 TaxID=858630 RepID=UPI002E79E0A3|nr:hypothetical protein [Streptomyces sp. JV176]MEE1797844.1 hypothetical protein [Streptomyces sp. JV176]